MQRPIDVNLPHKLGKEEARRRLASNIGSLERHIPGGAAVDHRWSGDTRIGTSKCRPPDEEAEAIPPAPPPVQACRPSMPPTASDPLSMSRRPKGSANLLPEAIALSP